MRTIHIKTERPYAIQVGNGLLQQLPKLLGRLYGETQNRKFVMITDDIVNQFYADNVQTTLQQAGYMVCKFVFPNGEGSKTLQSVDRIYSFLAQNEITRSDIILAVGGGVTGDLAGFVAATWLRGIELVQIPTTFLAMIDSSVGGKTGIDLPAGKNLAGAFWQPSLVVCDLAVLSTLPESVFADGIAEAIKYGAILDERLFKILETGALMQNLESVVCRCISLKREVVEVDERDRNIRQLLNFGHTFGHAIEKESNYTVSHGKAVSVGMVMIAKACLRQHMTTEICVSRLISCCKAYKLPISINLPIKKLCKHCMSDKKRSGDVLTIVIIEEIGKAKLYPLKADELCAFIGGEGNG